MYPSVNISAVLAQRGESVFRCVPLVRHTLRQKLLCFCFLFRSRLGLASTQTQAAASTHTHPYTERPKDTIEKTTDSLLLRCLVGDERVLLHALCKATKYEHETGWLACHPLGLLVTAFRFSSITYGDVACVQPRRKKRKKQSLHVQTAAVFIVSSTWLAEITLFVVCADIQRLETHVMFCSV